MKPFKQGRFADLPEKPRKPHPFFEMDAREVDVPVGGRRNVRLHVRTYGQGPPLLLVHGLMTTSYSWRYVLEPLGSHFTLHVPDLVGAGRSEKVLDLEYTPTNIARLIADLMRTLGIEGAPVIGNSMGGYLCMWLAMLEPGVMSRLVNLHSPGVPTARMYALKTGMLIPGGLSVTAWLCRQDPLRWAHANVHYYDESLKSLEEAREYGEPLRDPAGGLAFAKYLGETLDVRYMAEFVERLRDLSEFPVPLQLVYATRDPMVPPEVGRQLSVLVPDAELVWLEEASHFAHVDATQPFLQATAPFLGL